MNRQTFLGQFFTPSTIGKTSQQTSISSGSDLYQIRVREVKVYWLKRALFVQVISDQGTSGWGEANNKFPKTVIALIEKEMAPRIIGQRIFDTEPLSNLLIFKAMDSGPNALMMGALAGIDNALWDLKGRILKQPVYKLLGGPYTTSIPVYGSFGRGNRRPLSPIECARKAAEFVEQGYKAVKIRMQIRQLNVNPQPDPSFATVKEIRAAIGDDITLFFDANNGYTPYRAIQVGRKLYERYGIASFEEPVAEHNYEGMARVAKALDVPVTGGEHEYTRWMFRDLITRGQVGIINPDIFKSGGITECQKIATLASAFDVPVMCHNVKPTLATAAALHLVASIHNRAAFQEYGGERPEWNLQAYFQNNLIFKDGEIHLSDAPGWGLIPDEAAIRRDRLNK